MATDQPEAAEVAVRTRRAQLRRVVTSAGMLVDQTRINDFAKVTEDDQFIHVDPT